MTTISKRKASFFSFCYLHFFLLFISSQWPRSTISLPWGILQSWDQLCYRRQRIPFSLIKVHIQLRERSMGSCRHIRKNFLIFPSCCDTALELPGCRGDRHLQLERQKAMPWLRRQCQVSRCTYCWWWHIFTEALVFS